MGGAGVNLPRRGHQSRSAIASRRCWRDTSSFRMARSSLAVGLPSHSHSSSWKEVRSSKAVAMVPSSMGWGAVCSGILQGQGAGVNLPREDQILSRSPCCRARWSRRPQEVASRASGSCRRSVQRTAAP